MTRIDELLDQCPERMSAKDVAEVLGVTQRTVSTWLLNGDLPGYRLPGTWLVMREELRDYLRSRRTQREDGAPQPQPEDSQD